MALIRRARAINRALAEVYPDAHCELDHRDAFELLVATVLSAQCTDVRVNQVTPGLFTVYPDAHAMATEARRASAQARRTVELRMVTLPASRSTTCRSSGGRSA